MKKMLAAVAVSCLLAVQADAGWQYKPCILMSFFGDNINFTNMCDQHLYIIWYDGNGAHFTAIGPNLTRYQVDRTRGRVQIVTVKHQ
jgi:hypothetical protein